LRNYQGRIVTFRNPGAEETRVEEAVTNEYRDLVRS
jgi:hypothetical protein